MKKSVYMILAMVMALSLVACGNKEEKSVSADGPTSMQKAINAKVYLQCHRHRHPQGFPLSKMHVKFAEELEFYC